MDAQDTLGKVEPLDTFHISFPYLEGCIDKVSYSNEDDSFNVFVIIGTAGLLFDEQDVVFTRGNNTLPLLDKKQIRHMEQKKDETVSQYTIAIPCKSGSVDKVSYAIANNYLHINVQGSVVLSFNINRVSFTKKRRCSSGHENPDGLDFCEECGELMPLNDRAIIAHLKKADLLLEKADLLLEEIRRVVGDEAI